MLIEQATQTTRGLYELDRGPYLIMAWNSTDIRLPMSPPVTAASAHVPVGAPGCADGLVLVNRIQEPGEGRHEEMLLRVDALAAERLDDMMTG